MHRETKLAILYCRWICKAQKTKHIFTLFRKPHLLKYKYIFTCEQRHGNHFTAITRLLKTKSVPEIKEMYGRQPSLKSRTVITRRVVSIDFYRLIDWQVNVLTDNKAD